jgi:hypothetical protein
VRGRGRGDRVQACPPSAAVTPPKVLLPRPRGGRPTAARMVWRKHYIRESEGMCPKLSANGR